VRLPGIVLLSALFAAGAFAAGNPEYDRARELYQHTEYQQSLAALSQIAVKDVPDLKLVGQNYFMLGEHQKAIEAFDQALAAVPNRGTSNQASRAARSQLYHWLGRTHGRRAETGSVFTAPVNASKARASFEEAVRLDPTNQEAVNDLFDFYLQAPPFLGGSMEKAEALAQRIGQLNAAEGHYAQAQLDDKRKQYDEAEQQLRLAAELEPQDAGRWIDVAKHLARRGRIRESDAVLDQAVAIAPGKPQLLFARAEIYIHHRYRLDDARMLLDRYLRAPLTPDDPPRERARTLLERLNAARIRAVE
jgi:tetratricopeptide (TPR) repeat protein